MSFFAELKRRNVFKVGVAYAIVAWLLIQIVATVFPILALPEWTIRFITIVVIIGFPLALILAWIYELTPEGIKVTTSEGPDQYHTQTTGQRLNYFIIGVLVMVVTFLLVKDYVLKESPEVNGKTPATSVVTETVTPEKEVQEKAEEAAPSNSIAVLPFTNMSEDKANEYFADGIAEEILNSLARIKDLEVRGRTSSFYFKDKNEELTTISRMLNVEYVLEGSVRKAENQVRITVQLINAVKDEHLWSKTYERTLNDIFAIQEDIAKSVADTLQISLGVGELGKAPGMTRNIDAYDAYLHGNELFRRRGSSEDFTRATQYYREAVKLDPDFLRAWGSLYDALAGMLIFVPDQVVETRQEMEQVRKSLAERDPESPTYLTIMASYYMDERKWQESEAAYDALAHSNIFSGPTNHNLVASNTFLLNTGHVRLVTPWILRGRIDDPLSLSSSFIAQIILFVAGRHEESEKEYQRGLNLEGDHYLISTMAYLNNQLRKDLSSDQLQALTAKYLEKYSDHMIPHLTEVLRATDNKQKLDILHRGFNDSENKRATNMLMIAFEASFLGDTQLTLAALRRSYVDYKGTNLGMIWSPNFQAARKDPGFKDIVRDLGLVDYWRKTGHWGDYCHPVGENDFKCE